MSQLALGVGLGIGSMLLGFAFGSKADFVTEVKWWELMTAFGTVSAVGVALWASLREQLRHANERMARLRISAAAVRVRLAAAMTTFEQLDKSLSARLLAYREPEVLEGRYSNLDRVLASAPLSVTLQELDSLAGLPDSGAERLSRVQEIITLANVMAKELSHSGASPTGADERPAVYVAIQLLVKEAMQEIERAHTACAAVITLSNDFDDAPPISLKAHEPR